MRTLASLLTASLLTLLLAGCGDTAGDDGNMPMGPDSYDMQMSGMPMGAMSPGQMFNLTVQGMAGHGGMHAMASDHIGAHMWNMTMADPTAALANATACAHAAGDMPGTYTAKCTAPMQAGTYHVRAHARMMDEDQQMHHYWSDEQTFTVA